MTFEFIIKNSLITLWHQTTPWLRYVVKLEHSDGAWRYRMAETPDFISVDFDSKSEAIEQIGDDYSMMIDAIRRAGLATQ